MAETESDDTVYIESESDVQPLKLDKSLCILNICNNSNISVNCNSSTAGTNENSSLQAAFQRFRTKQVEKRRVIHSSVEAASDGVERTEAYKVELREKFIAEAKKCLGTIYSRYFLPDGSTEQCLDCCGLVRHCVQNLRLEFGFDILPFNQAYFFDTLPSIQQQNLKPGDLIFTEAHYLDSKRRPQKHNCVHVEIFLGETGPESTISSRFSDGCVSLHDTFRFASSKYDVVQYHFKSLDPWLNGVCTSNCTEHEWKHEQKSFDNRSIFNDDDDDVN